jgi:hypothetical protein
MELLRYKVERRIAWNKFKTVEVVKPANRKDFVLWLHCIGKPRVELSYRLYQLRKIERLLTIHGVRPYLRTEDDDDATEF